MTRVLARDSILGALPGTQLSIRAKTGHGASVVCRGIKALKEEGLIHVTHWEPHPGGGRPIAFWVLGPGHDAPMPHFTAAERAAFKHGGPARHHLMALFG